MIKSAYLCSEAIINFSLNYTIYCFIQSFKSIKKVSENKLADRNINIPKEIIMILSASIKNVILIWASDINFWSMKILIIANTKLADSNINIP